MSRHFPRGFALGAALVAAAGAGRATMQTAGTRTILAAVAPRPLDRGLASGDLSHAPDSPETLRRQSLRPAAAIVDRTGAAGTRYVPGKLLVKYRDGVSAATKLSTRSVAKAVAATEPSYADFEVMRVDPSQDVEALAAALRARPDVEWAQPAYRVHAMMVPNDPYYSTQQWNLPLIDMPRAWDIQPAAGSSITVAVLDTGVAYTNTTIQFSDPTGFTDPQGTVYPPLGNLTLQFSAAPQLAPLSRFVSPRDFIWGDDTPVDTDGHGTHVSGTIGQTTNDAAGTAGVAFNVKLMPVKVIDSEWDDIFGSPNYGTDDIVAQGIRYAVDNGAKVINMSIGRTGPSDCGTNPSDPGCAPSIESAIKYAVGKGAFVAIAAGNDFESGNPTETLAEIASRVPGAVSVAAVTRQQTHAYYSSTGSWVELSAPGGSFREAGAGVCSSTSTTCGGILQQTLDLDLVDTFDLTPAEYGPPRFDSFRYYWFIGTSQATPHVSGIAAMLMQQGITSPAAIEAALEKFATDLGDPGRDSTFGFGLVEARTTLRGLGLAK